jgi:disulfide bond formation protein DsbB
MDKTTKNNRKYWLLGGFVVGFFVVGVPYWQIPYAKVSLPDSLYGTGLLVVGVLAAAACGLGKARLFSVILVLGGSVPAAVLARVAVDTAKDPTSHNLWPFEFIIAAVVGVLCSSAGALVGSLPAWLSTHRDAA